MAAAGLRDPQQKWMLRQSRDVRRAFAKEVLDADDDETAVERWMLLQADEIRDEGRTLVVRGQTFSLRRLTGHFVLDGEPYYGTRVSLDADASREPTTD